MKRLIVALLFLFSSTALFSISWTWSSEYQGVTSFRYQINGERDDGWTVVPKDITTFTCNECKSSDILYVQQSLDNGRSWSESGKAQKVEKALKKEKGFNIGFSSLLSYERVLNENIIYPNLNSIGYEFEFALNDLLIHNNFGFDALLNLGTSFIPWDEFSISELFNKDKALRRYYFDLLARGNYSHNNLSFNFAFGGGFAVVMCKGVGNIEIGSGALVPAICLSLGLNYNFTNWFFIGLNSKYHYDTEAKVHRLASCIKIGVEL